MDKTKVKVMSVNVGKYDCDSITVNLDGVVTEICFDKASTVAQYKDKEIYLSKEDGVFVISPIEIKK